MTFAIGGSAKVRRVVKQARTEPWTCACLRTVVRPIPRVIRPSGVTVYNEPLENPAALTRCPDCGTRRP